MRNLKPEILQKQNCSAVSTCKMSLCLCKVCLKAALCDKAPGVCVYSAILSLTVESCKQILNKSKL